MFKFTWCEVRTHCNPLEDLFHVHVSHGELTRLFHRKSTVMRMLYRFYDPASGRILINNTDIRDVDLDSLRRSVGVVPQVSVLRWIANHC